MIWARPGGAVARVGFKPTALCMSFTRDRGAVLHHVPTRPSSHQTAITDVRDPDHSLSLSPLTIKRKTLVEVSFFSSLSPQLGPKIIIFTPHHGK
jgi:hypothetical protein